MKRVATWRTIRTGLAAMGMILAWSSCTARPAGVDALGKVVLRSISWTATPTEARIIRELVEEFNRLHPEAQVVHEIIERDYPSKLLTYFAAGNAPDVFWVSAQEAWSYIDRNCLYDITDFISEEGLDTSDFFPPTLEPFVRKGRYYGLPNDACTCAVFYNKEMFDQAGLAYPRDDWTWDAFVADARALTQDSDGDGRPDQWGFILPGMITLWYPFVYSNEGCIFDFEQPDHALFDQPACVEAFRKLTDLAFVEKVAPLRGDIGDQGERRGFQMGKVAMMVSGWWDMTDTDEYAPDLRYGVAPIPILRVPGNHAFATATCIYRNSPHPRLAWEFVKFMTGKRGQLVRCKARMAGPSRRSVAQDPYFVGREKDQVFLKAMNYAFGVYGGHYRILEDELSLARDRVLQEIQTPENALREAKRDFVRRISYE